MNTGDQFRPDTAIALGPGSFTKHPGGAHHYDGAKEGEVILAISGHGPSKDTVLDGGDLFGYSMPRKPTSSK